MWACDGVCTFLGITWYWWYAGIALIFAFFMASTHPRGTHIEEGVMALFVGALWPVVALFAIIYGAIWALGFILTLPARMLEG